MGRSGAAAAEVEQPGLERRVGAEGAAGPVAEDADGGDDGRHRFEAGPGDRDRVGVERLVAPVARGPGPRRGGGCRLSGTRGASRRGRRRPRGDGRCGRARRARRRMSAPRPSCAPTRRPGRRRDGRRGGVPSPPRRRPPSRSWAVIVVAGHEVVGQVPHRPLGARRGERPLVGLGLPAADGPTRRLRPAARRRLVPRRPQAPRRPPVERTVAPGGRVDARPGRAGYWRSSPRSVSADTTVAPASAAWSWTQRSEEATSTGRVGASAST